MAGRTRLVASIGADDSSIALSVITRIRRTLDGARSLVYVKNESVYVEPVASGVPEAPGNVFDGVIGTFTGRSSCDRIAVLVGEFKRARAA